METARVTSLLVARALVPAALVVLLADWWRLRCQRSILENERDRERKLRLSERAGRTAAERKLRQGLQQQQQQAPACNSNSECAPAATGPCTYVPIGRIASCFIERRGTPRQGLLAPAARATLKLDAHVVQPRAALEGLEDFSHVWLLYDFHENTNATKLKPLGGSSGGGDGGSSSSSGGSRTSQVKAKVHPPGLGGERIGLFATRTPHRPNPIGLSAARLLEIRGDTLVLGGADLVDGTPILDVKVR
jgi:tRNA (adenine37-N6)-methyltransferase